MHRSSAPLRFPSYLSASFGGEYIDLSVENEKNSKFIQLLARFDQVYDQAQAYSYAEKNIAKLRLMNPHEIFTFIREIHSIAGRTLVMLSPQGYVSGDLTPVKLSIRQETGLTGENFESQDPGEYSEKNANLLRKKYGEKVAQDYKSFNLACLDELKAAQSSLEEISLSAIEFIAKKKLDKRPDFYAFQKIYKFTESGKNIENLMRKFCQELHFMLQNKKDPFDVAAFVLHQLITIHPFVNANRRTARIVMNSILLAQGVQPVLIPPDSKEEYYSLIEMLTVSNLSKLAEMLRRFAKVKHEQLDPLVPLGQEVTVQVGMADIDVCGMLCDEYYETLPLSQVAEYQAQSEGLPDKHKKIVAARIDGDACYFKAKKFEKSHPQIASYLFYRCARFYEAVEEPRKAIQARRLAEKLTPQKEIEFKDHAKPKSTTTYKEYLAALIEFKDDKGVSVEQALDKLIKEDQPSEYLARLAVVCGESVVRLSKDEKGKVAFPLSWLRNLGKVDEDPKKDPKIELAKKLGADVRKLSSD